MADLSDLDTSTIGFIAYWNSLNHGVSNINPTEVLQHTNITEYTQMDNGVEGKYEISYKSRFENRIVNFRVKDDGWFVVWFDRTNNLGANLNYGDNYLDLVNDWTDFDNNVNPEHHNLERVINQLYEELDNSGSITYRTIDVGIYNYEYNTANTITQISEQEPDPDNMNGGISYTSSIKDSIQLHLVGGTVKDPDRLGFTDTDNITDGSSGVIDVLANGLMPKPDTYYFNDATQDSEYGDDGVIVHLMLWG